MFDRSGVGSWRSTYFAGAGPAIAKHGYSRDGRPRNVQVVVGVVMIAGWPIAHHVWAGNTRDSKTVKEVVTDLTTRFHFGRVPRGGHWKPFGRFASASTATSKRMSPASPPSSAGTQAL